MQLIFAQFRKVENLNDIEKIITDEKYNLELKEQVNFEEPKKYLKAVSSLDKKENNIDKLACSEFWKAKDSYRQLQNAFYNYMVSHNFELERGLPKEETSRQSGRSNV